MKPQLANVNLICIQNNDYQRIVLFHSLLSKSLRVTKISSTSWEWFSSIASIHFHLNRLKYFWFFNDSGNSKCASVNIKHLASFINFNVNVNEQKFFYREKQRHRNIRKQSRKIRFSQIYATAMLVSAMFRYFIMSFDIFVKSREAVTNLTQAF